MLDQLSPAAPARVRVVLLPIGHIKRSRFLSFIARLEPENVVRLGDISPDGRPNRNMFSPLGFQMGMIVYDLTTFYPPPSHVALSPFELYREPLVILALADGAELNHISHRDHRRSLNGTGATPAEQNVRQFYQDLEELRDQYPKALVHQVLLFDHVPGKLVKSLPEGVVGVPPPEDCKRTTMKTIMCDISSMLLAEMTTLAKSLQALNTIESPSSSQLSNLHFNGASASPYAGDNLSRRNSQYSLPGDSRSGSPAGPVDRSHVRMSMPVFSRTDSNTSSTSGRPGTPVNSSKSETPAATFEDIVASNSTSDLRNSQKAVPARFNSPDLVRETSRDRVSVTGFGSGSISERSRNKGKGRIGVVIGSLYLKAGRWGDAMKELVEAATIAKSNMDHLWHAKALDNILVSMLMLAWTGLDFTIPQICYVSAEKASLTTTHEPRSPASNRLVSLQNLTTLLPELVDRILNLYARAANNTGESLPQFPFSESVIRFSKLLAAIHLADGWLNDDVLVAAVLGTPFRNTPNLIPRLDIRPTRTEIVTTLFRAFPTSSYETVLPVVDRTIILSGIASVLGSIGFYRKKAMVIRELVGYLIPGLVQARIKGAAEVGVHPAAGLAALNSGNGSMNGAGALDLGEGDIEIGVDSFLASFAHGYGVISSPSTTEPDGVFDDSNDAVVARILENASIRAFGGHNLKMDVLRLCINVAEALPDFQGVLKFTADLLRTAGSGIAPGPRSSDASPAMSREEQVRLSTNISRTLSAARNMGVRGLEAEYWDDFLLRGIEVEPLQASKTPIPHNRSELPGATSVAAARAVNPFIYNPFLRTPDAAAADHLLVAGEGAIFKITLQNPFEFDVEIESLRIEAEGVDFESAVQKTIISPYRTQILTIPGTPRSSGQLKLTGCVIKVHGCRERRFPIFVAPWSPEKQVKIKTIGVATLFKPKDRPVSVASGPVSTTPAVIAPKAVSVSLNVIDKQPVVIVRSTTLSQSALMVLEGERQVFSITLQNISKDTPVDLLLFSFKDSTQGPLQAILSNRESPPAEMYECELILAHKQALQWKKINEKAPFIAPGETASFEIEVLGKPGLTSGIVQIDYAYLGVPAAEVQEKFHTRQVSLPLTVTVNASVELAKIDILPLSGSVPRSLWSSQGKEISDNTSFHPEDYCLLVLDLRNAWPVHLQVQLKIGEGSIEEEILPGNTSRLMFPIRRIFLSDPWAAIPSLDPARQRQFVVSTGRVSADSERASREAFWYREEILKILHGRWSTKSGPHRHGEIELRSIRLSQRMIEAIRIDDVGIDLSIIGAEAHDSVSTLFIDQFSQLKVQIQNRTAEPIAPLLRLQPLMKNQAHVFSSDVSKRLVLDGLLQQTLPLLQGKETVEYKIGLIALARGEYEISASVEEARLLDSQDEDAPKAENKRPRANTKLMMDAVLGTKERRVWHSREPLIVVAKDEEDSYDHDNDE